MKIITNNEAQSSEITIFLFVTAMMIFIVSITMVPAVYNSLNIPDDNHWVSPSPTPQETVKIETVSATIIIPPGSGFKPVSVNITYPKEELK